MKKIRIKTILEKFQKLASRKKIADSALTYEQGLEIAHTFRIYDEDKNRYINYLRNLAAERNNQFLKGIADGLDMIVNSSCSTEH